MLTWIAELLPLFVVRWICKRRLQRVPLGGYVVVEARPDVLFVVED